MALVMLALLPCPAWLGACACPLGLVCRLAAACAWVAHLPNCLPALPAPPATPAEMLRFMNRPTSVSQECCFSADVGEGTTMQLCISPRNWVNRRVLRRLSQRPTTAGACNTAPLPTRLWLVGLTFTCLPACLPAAGTGRIWP